MRSALVVLAGALSFSVGLDAQNAVAPGQPAPIDVEKVCAEAEKVPVPAEYLRGVTADAKCSPLELYYDKSPNHFQQSLRCGLAQWQMIEAREKAGTQDGDSAVDEDEQLALAMIFANGEGVRKNLPLARRFACEADNYVNTDEVLAAIDGEKLDVCADNYGRRINYLCLGIKGADVDTRIADAELKARRALRPAALIAWKNLEVARKDYLKAHGPEEPNGTTGAVQSAMQEDLDTETAWLDVLKSVAAGRVPEGVLNAPALDGLDKALNVAYQQALSFGVQYCEGGQDCASSESTRTAERAWLKYREAWVKFGAVRWPEVPADKWRAWLTVDRTEKLGG